jgi:hypothetical protein
MNNSMPILQTMKQLWMLKPNFYEERKKERKIQCFAEYNSLLVTRLMAPTMPQKKN